MGKVPKDIGGMLVMTYWWKLLTDDMATASIKLPPEIFRTDVPIQQARSTTRASS